MRLWEFRSLAYFSDLLVCDRMAKCRPVAKYWKQRRPRFETSVAFLCEGIQKNMKTFFFLVVSLTASTLGAICGIGGGVIIRPLLDALHMGSIAEISFLSGCAVLAMSLYSVCRNLHSRSAGVELKTGTPLAIGAAFGGVAGKKLFDLAQMAFSAPAVAGGLQATVLAIITLGTLCYVQRKPRIQTLHVQGILPCVTIGGALGALSSFLGIGGGPINLVVLHYYFSMDSKRAASNSLYIILFSQIASIITAALSRTIPECSPASLCWMIAGGIGGGILGRRINKKIDNSAVDRMFSAVLLLIAAISIGNAWKYFS